MGRGSLGQPRQTKSPKSMLKIQIPCNNPTLYFLTFILISPISQRSINHFNLNTVRWWNVTARRFPRDVAAVLAFHPENNPQASPKHLHQCHSKRDNVRVLNVGVENNQKNPCHTEDGVDDYNTFVPPCGLKGEDITEVARCLFLG